MSRPILEVSGLTMRFGGLLAVNNVALSVQPKQVVSIIGPNGAGKTTMMDVITGKTRPDNGVAYFGEQYDLTAMSEVQIAQAGIGRKFQKPTVFEALSVFENLELALKTDKSVWASLRAKLSGAQKDRIEEVLTTIRLEGSRHRPAGRPLAASEEPRGQGCQDDDQHDPQDVVADHIGQIGTGDDGDDDQHLDKRESPLALPRLVSLETPGNKDGILLRHHCSSNTVRPMSGKARIVTRLSTLWGSSGRLD